MIMWCLRIYKWGLQNYKQANDVWCSHPLPYCLSCLKVSIKDLVCWVITTVLIKYNWPLDVLNIVFFLSLFALLARLVGCLMIVFKQTLYTHTLYYYCKICAEFCPSLRCWFLAQFQHCSSVHSKEVIGYNKQCTLPGDVLTKQCILWSFYVM